MSRDPEGFTSREWWSVGSLCGVFGLRMLGLFLILPVLSPFARQLPGSTPFLIGLAVGAYALTQTLFQVPFGWLSDRYGRKPLIVAGLVLFGLGSLWAAYSRSIWSLILARMLQGGGAVAAVIVAMIADVTRDRVRTRAMAMIGVAVGLAFGIGFVAGPYLAGHWGVPLVFEIIAVLTGGAVLVALLLLPEPRNRSTGDGSGVSIDQLKTVLNNSTLWRVDFGIFVLHGCLTAVFVVLPFLLQRLVSSRQTWLIYLPVLLASGLIMLPAIFVAERRGRIREVMFGSMGVLAAGFGLFVVGSSSLTGLISAMFFFFTGFSLLSAIMPSLITRLAPPSQRGTAVGIYNMSQFLGSFCGGVAGGVFLKGHPSWLFVVLAGAVGAWAWVSLGLPAVSPGKARV